MKPDGRWTAPGPKVIASVKFEKDEKGARLMAVHTAQLVREGVLFYVADLPTRWEVEITDSY
jgi:hypothetical protein